MADEHEMSLVEGRNHLSQLVHAALAEGRITYLTFHRKRAAAIVPLAIADQSKRRSGERLDLRCPYCHTGMVWSTDDGAHCVNPDPDAGGAPGCGAEWDACGRAEKCPAG